MTMMTNFNLHGDYKQEFRDYVDALTHKNNTEINEMDPVDIVPIVDDLINAYVDTVGDVPESFQLERLANLLLKTELKDPNSYKMTHNPEPILSEQQMQRRATREMIPLDAISEVYDSNKNYKAFPKRKERRIGDEIRKDFKRSFEIQKQMDDGEI